MKVSLKDAQWFSNVNLNKKGVDAVASTIGLQLGAVEDVIDLKDRYESVVVGRVASCEKHPNADKLTVCMVDDGGATKDVERDKDGNIEVICGAPNVKADQTIVYIPPGATVPETFGTDEPFILDSREIRGVLSNGMIASKKELAISDEHEGILDLDKEEVENKDDLRPGTAFTKLFDLDDAIFDLENKMFTHRPDCFGTLGVARELAGIQNLGFKSPDWYLKPEIPQATAAKPVVGKVEAKKFVPRFTLITVDDIKIGESPLWLQLSLSRVGIKPINSVVDITNFVMHLTAQPLHAYDYEKVTKRSKDKPTLIARQGIKDEELKLLGGKTIKVSEEDIVISTDNELVGIGGVMGGAETEVDENTTAIILECGSFDMYATRRTAMRHGLFTDAVTRFTKNQSPLQNHSAVAYAIKLIQDLAGGKVASDYIDVKQDSVAPYPDVVVSLDLLNSRLGSDLSTREVKSLLENVEIECEVSSKTVTIKPPFWRTDLEIAEDIIEEVGRLYGFHNLPVELPQSSSSPTVPNSQVATNNLVRDALSSAGANEVLTYSFVKEDLISKAKQDPKRAYKIRNALSPDLQYYRLSLMPSLLEQVRPNIKAGNLEVNLYELNVTHDKKFPDENEKEVPKEWQWLSFVTANDNKTQTYKTAGAAYYKAQTYLRALLTNLHVEYSLRPQVESDSQHLAPYQLERSAEIISNEGDVLGVVGEFKAAVVSGFRLPTYSAGFELNMEVIAPLINSSKMYKPLSIFPQTDRDLTLDVPDEVIFGDLFKVLSSLAKETDASSIMPLSIYRGKDQTTSRNISFRIQFVSHEKTLKTDQVNEQLKSITDGVAKKFKTSVV